MIQTPPPAPDSDVALSDLVERARRLVADGRRRILGIAGTPGAGKSTVSAALLDALGPQAVVVGMDGFHLANAELVRLHRRDRKGAPDTFDVDGYLALLRRLRAPADGVVYAPAFDRGLEEPIASAIPVPADVPLIITEGNYLLHTGHGWERVRELLDESWFLDIEPDTRRRRLVARRRSHGHPLDEATAWVRDVDEANAAVVEGSRARADLVVRLSSPAAPAAPIALAAGTLQRLPAAVARPAYDRARVRPGIVHLGVGNFHRAHEAMFVDRLLAAGDADWGISGVGLLPHDAAMRDALAAQDGLYTLVTVTPDGTESARVIGALTEYLFAPDDPEAVQARLSDPATRIVSLTITEGGYGIDERTGAFVPQDAATLADLDDAAHGRGTPPRSALGHLAAALARRRAAGIAPFTVLSCDNIPGNGGVARTALSGFADRLDPELGAWIRTHVAFPHSMVDRITPVTTDETRALVRERFGVDDRWPVRSEDFVQWVLEDRFPLGRPAFDTVGVQLVDDVEPYELMKLRLLNASHQAMSYLGILAGATMVHEVCADPLFRTFLRGYMQQEAVPTLRPVPGIDLDAYGEQLLARFGSTAVRDTLARQVVDGSDRIPTFLLPVVRERLATGGSIAHAVLVLAAWSVFLEGVAEDGTPTPVSDRRLALLRAAVAAEAAEPGAFLDCTEVFGDLGRDARLRAEFVAARASLRTLGARASIAALG
ncbi:nucleoside/nucleotide kinase family protein [Microbacterium sp. NPDC060132]|uniref:nucleoside/nucleotide kinase family protein n=1 Tax=unclassified Microbacterium TaxID=2609290 RepID=UPI003660389B